MSARPALRDDVHWHAPFGTANLEAGQISRNNPYRSFNISGINYGSQQWDREHRQVQSKPAPARTWRRGLFRR